MLPRPRRPRCGTSRRADGHPSRRSPLAHFWTPADHLPCARPRAAHRARRQSGERRDVLHRLARRASGQRRARDGAPHRLTRTHSLRALPQCARDRRAAVSRNAPSVGVGRRQSRRCAARAARHRIRRSDASRSWPHDLGRARSPRLWSVRPCPRRDVSAGTVGGPHAVTSPQLHAPPRSSYRWTICALLFVVTTINYMDRQVLSILAPTLQRELSWSESQYAFVVYSFTLVYAFGFLIAGRSLDRVGVRRGFATAVVVWSLAAIGTALARTTAGFAAARALLGFGESANIPGAIKTVGEWFPKDERALATGIFNAGTNTGAILTPLLVPWITLTWGWRWAFVVVGSLGFVWLFVWLVLYRSPPATARSEDVEEPSTRVPWIRLLGMRQTWAIVAGKLLADPIWWFYLYWLPKFLDTTYGIKLAHVALPLITVYVIADVGSIGGGWLSSGLLKRGWTVNRARKTAMLLMALAIIPTALAPQVGSMWGAVFIVSLAAAAHQGWSANVYTLASDMFPPNAVASVSGIGGFAGAMGGALFQLLTGRILDANGNDYTPIFVVCGLAYVTAWTIIQVLAPKLEPVRLKELA